MSSRGCVDMNARRLRGSREVYCMVTATATMLMTKWGIDAMIECDVLILILILICMKE